MRLIAMPRIAEHRRSGVVDVPATEVRALPSTRPDHDEDHADEQRVAGVSERVHQASLRLQDVERANRAIQTTSTKCQ